MQADITYKNDGMFTRFFPETKAGESVWCEMVEQHGVAAVLNFEAQRVIAQIRAAGYKVAKAKKAPAWTAADDQLLAELGV